MALPLAFPCHLAVDVRQTLALRRIKDDRQPLPAAGFYTLPQRQGFHRHAHRQHAPGLDPFARLPRARFKVQAVPLSDPK